MTPRPDVSQQRREQILNAAETVLMQKGFDAARMDDIAEEAGLSKGTLYLYFTSKDQLIIAILDRIFQSGFRESGRPATADLSATERIWQVTEALIRETAVMLRLLPIAYEFLALAFRNRQVQQALKRYLSRYMKALTSIIEAGIASGEFRRVDPQEVAIAAGAIMEGTLLLWVYDKGQVDPERHIRSGIRLLLEGIQTGTHGTVSRRSQPRKGSGAARRS